MVKSSRVLMGPLVFTSILAATVLLVAATSPVKRGAAAGFPRISLHKIADGFEKPTWIGHAGDGSGRLFVVEQSGLIKIIKDGKVLPKPFLDISSRVSSGGERGLFVVVFPKGYEDGEGSFYVNYTGRLGDTHISRFRSSGPDSANPGSEQVLLRIKQPFANHNGGQMAFGPDGFLYIGTGDGGAAADPFENAQDPGSLLGKILRIEPKEKGAYEVPSSNPFVDKEGYRPEIWALGLRNPWRFSFDRKNGDLYIGDVGQDDYEEIDLQPASSRGGENYGWDIMEGRHCFKSISCNQAGLTLPIAEYEHSGGGCSVTGGFVYRGPDFPALQGVYIYGDYCSGRIRGLRQINGKWENSLLLDTDLMISTFGEDEAGSQYVADHAKGGIYRIVPAAVRDARPRVPEQNS